MPSDDDIPYIDHNRITWDGDSPLGEGSFGIVYRGLYNNSPCAIKVVKRPPPEQSNSEDFQQQTFAALKQHRREIHRFRAVQNPYIIQYLGVFRDSDPHGLYIITEFLEGGSLYDSLERMRARNAILEERSFLQIALHIAYGLNHVHSESYTHGDMKPQNVLLTSQLRFLRNRPSPIAILPDSAKVKIADFGLSKRLDGADVRHTTVFGSTTATAEFGPGPCGTFLYLSPEAYKGPSQLDDNDAKAADVYAYALILFELLSGMQSWCVERVTNPMQLYQLVLAGKRPNWGPRGRDIHEDYITLVESCWAQDPRARPTVHNIIVRLRDLEQLYRSRTPQPQDDEFGPNLDSPPSTSLVSRPESPRDSRSKPSQLPQAQQQQATAHHPTSAPCARVRNDEDEDEENVSSDQLVSIGDEETTPFVSSPERRPRSPVGDDPSNENDAAQSSDGVHTPRQSTSLDSLNDTSTSDDYGGSPGFHRVVTKHLTVSQANAERDRLKQLGAASFGAPDTSGESASTQDPDGDDDDDGDDDENEHDAGVTIVNDEEDDSNNHDDVQRKDDAHAPSTFAAMRQGAMPNVSIPGLDIPDLSIVDAPRVSPAGPSVQSTGQNSLNCSTLSGSMVGEVRIKHVDSLQINAPQMDIPEDSGMGLLGSVTDQPSNRSGTMIMESFVNAANGEVASDQPQPLSSNPSDDTNRPSQPLDAPKVSLTAEGIGLDIGQIVLSANEPPAAEAQTKDASPAGGSSPHTMPTDASESSEETKAAAQNAAVHADDSESVDDILEQLAEHDFELKSQSEHSLKQDVGPKIRPFGEHFGMIGQTSGIAPRVQVNPTPSNNPAFMSTASVNPAQNNNAAFMTSAGVNPALGNNSAFMTTGGAPISGGYDSHPPQQPPQQSPQQQQQQQQQQHQQQQAQQQPLPPARPPVNHAMHMGQSNVNGFPVHGMDNFNNLNTAHGSPLMHPVNQTSVSQWSSPSSGQMHTKHSNIPPMTLNQGTMVARVPQRDEVYAMWLRGQHNAVGQFLARNPSLRGDEMLGLCLTCLNHSLKQDRLQRNAMVLRDLSTAIGNIARNPQQAITTNMALHAIPTVLTVMHAFPAESLQAETLYAACNYALCNLLKVNNKMQNQSLRDNISIWVSYTLRWILQRSHTRSDILASVGYTATSCVRNFIWMNQGNVAAFLRAESDPRAPPMRLLLLTVAKFDEDRVGSVVEAGLSALAMIVYYPRFRLDFVKNDGLQIVNKMVINHVRESAVATLCISIITVLFCRPVEAAGPSYESLLVQVMMKGEASNLLFGLEHAAKLLFGLEHAHRVENEVELLDVLEKGFQAVLSAMKMNEGLKTSLIRAGATAIVTTCILQLDRRCGNYPTSNEQLIQLRGKLGVVLCEVVRVLRVDAAELRYLTSNGVARSLEGLLRGLVTCEAFYREGRAVLDELASSC